MSTILPLDVAVAPLTGIVSNPTSNVTTRSVQVKLTVNPNDTVTVAVSLSNATRGLLSTNTLIFTANK